MEGCLDSDFTSKATDRRSVSGFVVVCADARCVPSPSKIQRSVALSLWEAEYVAMADGMNEAIFLRYMWTFFPGRHVGCAVIYEDIFGLLFFQAVTLGVRLSSTRWKCSTLANNPATSRLEAHRYPILLHPEACREGGVQGSSHGISLAARGFSCKGASVGVIFSASNFVTSMFDSILFLA